MTILERRAGHDYAKIQQLEEGKRRLPANFMLLYDRLMTNIQLVKYCLVVNANFADKQVLEQMSELVGAKLQRCLRSHRNYYVIPSCYQQ